MATSRRRFPPEVLTNEEVMSLLKACGDATPTAIRNVALIAILYRGGLRVSEALGLRPHDVDAAVGSARVLFGKGGKARTIGLDPGALAVMQRWLEVRSRLPVGPNSPLLCTIWGGPVSTAYVRRLLPRLARRANILKRVHAHGLRHTHAAQLRAEGVDVGIISRQLGHTSLLTTIRYLDHIAPTAVVEVMKNRRWKISRSA